MGSLPGPTVKALAALYTRIERQRWVQGLMRGVPLAVVGLLLTVCWSIISKSGIDWRSWIIASAAFGIGLTGRVNILLILGLAACAGYLLYGQGQ